MNGSSWLDHVFDNYQTVTDNGSPLPQRPILTFIGATVSDNAGAQSTEVTIGDTGITQLTGDVTAGPGSGSLASVVEELTGAGGFVTVLCDLKMNGAGTYAAFGSLRFLNGTIPLSGAYAGDDYAILAFNNGNGILGAKSDFTKRLNNQFIVATTISFTVGSSNNEHFNFSEANGGGVILIKNSTTEPSSGSGPKVLAKGGVLEYVDTDGNIHEW